MDNTPKDGGKKKKIDLIEKSPTASRGEFLGNEGACSNWKKKRDEKVKSLRGKILLEA